jgi:hypothetical protein
MLNGGRPGIDRTTPPTAVEQTEMPKTSKLSVAGNVRSFVNVVREVNIDELRANAEMAPRILVTARSEDDAKTIAGAIAGGPGSPFVIAASLDALPRSGQAFDAVVVFDPTSSGAVARVTESLRAKELQLPVVAFKGAKTGDTTAIETTREEIAAATPDRATAFGRHLPAFRPAAVKAIVDQTARANAQFALVSNFPSAIPIIGSLMAAGADMLVLTKNQVLLTFKIAAIHNRDLHDQRRILAEILPVVGAGFFWRTLAREAASFLPLLIGTLPKIGIAYIGTVVAGRGADYYYRFGKKPTKEQVREFYQQAAEMVKTVPIPGRSAADADQQNDASAA